MKKNEVYVVTTGIYSDYHIVGCFDNKEQAETCARLSIGEVETYYMNDIEYKDNRNMYVVKYYVPKGRVTCDQVSIDPYLEEKLTPEVYKVFSKYVATRVRANSEDEAKKIGLDLIAQFRANEGGI